jgi:DNA-binding NtrC family response regulator
LNLSRSSFPGRCALAGILAAVGLDIVFASSVGEAREILLGQPIRSVLCEDILPDGSFHDVLRTLKFAGLRVPLVVCSLLREMDQYLEAMESGAFDFIAPPFRPTELESILNSVLSEYSPEGKKLPLVEKANLGWAEDRKVAS